MKLAAAFVWLLLALAGVALVSRGEGAHCCGHSPFDLGLVHRRG